MLRLLATLAAVSAATVCQDLTTPTDTHVTGSVLLQSSQNRDDRDRQPLNASRREDSYAFLPWQILFLLKGDRQLLWEGSADGRQGGDAGFSSLVICLCILVSVCLCAWSSKFTDDAGKGTALPASSAGPWSTRQSLEPASRGREARGSLLLQERSSSSPRRRTFAKVCCPDLVVPAGSQSVMGVPSLAVLDSAEVLDVVDPIGMPLLKVEVCQSAPRHSEPVESSAPLLVLRNLQPEPRGSLLKVPATGWVGTSAMVLAFLRQRGASLEICSPDLSVFGSLEQEPSGRFVLSGSEGTVCMTFQSAPTHDSLQDTITVTDANNQVLARTQADRLQFPEPAGRFYSLQAYSGVDVGVVLCCLFFMDGRARDLF